MRTRVRSRFGLVQGMCRVPGFERAAGPGRPDGSRGAGAGRRSPEVPGAGRLRPGLLPGPDRGSRPGLPRLDGRLPRLLRAAVGRLSPGIRHLRPGAGARSLRLAGDPQQLSLRLEEPGGNTAGRTPVLDPDPAGILAGSRADRPGAQPALRLAALAATSAWLAARWRSGRDRGSSGRRRSFAGFSGEYRNSRRRVAKESLAAVASVESSGPAGRRSMSSPALHLVIDARPRGPRGPLAAEVVLGRPLLSHLLEQALSGRRTRPDRSPSTPGRTSMRCSSAWWVTSLPGRVGCSSRARPRPEPRFSGPTGFTTLAAFAGPSQRGRSPETAVIWRLDRAELARGGRGGAERRRLTYQPLGRFWAFPLAERLAAALEPTRVRPNGLTLAAGGLMLDRGRSWRPSEALAAAPGIATALALAAALVLDTADGRLARLQGTSSAFGRWLDQVLDELADLALHAAIAWSVLPVDRPARLAGPGHALRRRASTCSSSSRSPARRWKATGGEEWGRAAVRSQDRPMRRAVSLLRQTRPARRPCRSSLASLDRSCPGRPARPRAGCLTRFTSRSGRWAAG